MVERAVNDQTARNVIYAKWRDDKPAEPGYSRELISVEVDPKNYDDIDSQIPNFNGCKTILEHFEYQVNRRRNHPFLGSRQKQADGTFGGYEWQTYGEIEQIA